MADELIDVVNEKDEIVSQEMKSKVHGRIDLIHREIAIAVFNKEGEILIQQRSMKKKNDPGMWTITAAGHVGSGEDPLECAEREILEELGLAINAQFFDKIFERDEKYQESKFYYLFYAITDQYQLKLQEEEVMDAKWLTIEDAVNNYLTSETSIEIIKRMSKELYFIK